MHRLLRRPYGLLAMTGTLLFLLFLPLFLFADEPPKRDVFKPTIQRPVPGSAPAAGQPINVTLEGISIGSKASFAVINGIVLHEGEEKSGIKAVKIRRREVDIEVSGVPRTLQMVVYDGAAGKGPRPEAPKPEESLDETAEEEGPEPDIGL